MTTKQYLKYAPGSTFGTIGSSTSSILHVGSRQGDLVAVGACEDVMIWNLKTKEKHLVLHGEKESATCLIENPRGKYLAVGYANGMVRVFDLRTAECITSFIGHKSSVSCLAFNEGGFILCSGGKDTEIVLWDIIEQSGVFRLKGHTNSITKCHFMKHRNALISSSKDTLIKFWDLDTQHCFQTLIGNRNEVLDFIVIKDTRLITGLNGPDLKVWDLLIKNDDTNDDSSKKLPTDADDDNSKKPRMEAEGEEVNHNEEDVAEKIKFVDAGKILTLGEKTVDLFVDKSERLFGCHAWTRVLQLFKILNDAEIAKKFSRRRKKSKKNMKKKTEADEDDDEEEDVIEKSELSISLSDQIQNLKPIEVTEKIQSFCMDVNAKGIAKIYVLLKNNIIALYALDTNDKNNLATLSRSISIPGHRTTVRSLHFSTDDSSILSASEESVKIWRTFEENQKCTQTMPCGFALCSLFVPGNSHCIIGTKEGTLQIFEINSMELLDNIDAHDAAIDCMCMLPGKSGFVTGGKDKDVKFWDFELVKDDAYSEIKKKLTAKHKRTLKMTENILSLTCSPLGDKIGIALLDNTVQVLFIDTLRLAFSLYGHVLPVTCLDISYDGSLIATGSDDKNIRIWSMEFGNCNKFIKKAHDKGITCLKFIARTHMFFTGSKDGCLKQWDGDKFIRIITLKGHQNDITALTINTNGTRVVTASRDQSIRIWVKTEEILVLEEEQELEREAAAEENPEDLPLIPGEVNKEVGLAGLKTMETIKSVDHLIEAIDVYKAEALSLEDHKQRCEATGKDLPPPPPHPLLIAYSSKTPLEFMMNIMRKVKSSELEGALLYLPFNYVLDFLKIMCEFADRGWAIELTERCTSFLLRCHLGQICSTSSLEPVIRSLRESLLDKMYETKDNIGFSLTGIRVLHQTLETREEVALFMDAMQNKKKKRKKRNAVRHFVALS